MLFKRKLKRCPQCKLNGFKVTEIAVYNAELNRKTGKLDVQTVVSNTINEAVCRNCGQPLKVGKIDFDFFVTG